MSAALISPQTPTAALTIAGSDSGGGAGIAADLHTFAAHGVFGTLAITAVTAQNTEKVHRVISFEPDMVQSQIDAVLGDFSIAAAKTGMLATTAIINALCERASLDALPPLVVDPVMVSSTAASLCEGDVRTAYQRLISHALVVTPNLVEAEVLCDRPIRSISAMIDAARELCDLGAAVAVVKGGHLLGSDAIDVVYDGDSVHQLHAERIDTRNCHGTGCTLSAAITANLALGRPVLDAISEAKSFVTEAIRAGATWNLGSGAGPIGHFRTVR